MARHVLLLRGVNLGPKRRLPMAELRSVLEGGGYTGVATYVQSGNVVLDADGAPDDVAAQVATLIEQHFGFDVPILARSETELAAVVSHDPIAGAAADPKHYQVTFLTAEPAAEAIARLQSRVVETEQLATAGREIYSWHPDGIARSKLAAGLSAKQLGAGATARNWTTVTTLLSMAGA